MTIQLSDHFTYGKLLRFTLPSIVMMIFTSIYSIVDGLFVSNFVGKTAFAAVNFVMPVIMMLGAWGIMLGTGGSALVAKTLGEGKEEKARSLFSLFVWTGAVGSAVMGVVGCLVLRPLCALLGAEGEMLERCVLYGRILMAALPFYCLQYEFQSFYIVAERPKLGLVLSVVTGVCNIVLDFLMVGVLQWGLAGAAVATGLSQAAGSVVSIVYFTRPEREVLRLTKPEMDAKALLKACTNGSSELMSNIAMSLVGMLYNIQLMKYAGENGVAAYGAVMYVNMIFLSTFFGYASGIAPAVSFHFGAKNRAELKSLLRKSLAIIGAFSLGMFALGEILAVPLSTLFVGYDAALLAMTVRAFRIYSLSYLLSGAAVFGSSFFTALNDGLTSAVISFLRTVVFETAAVLIMPLLWGLDGVWFSILVAEAMAVALTAAFLVKHRGKYGYF